jgi:aryl-alcohol dehydrogenase-like predicted oxidoreductase
MARNDSVCGMDYTHLGRSGVSVSRICLGTMNFGAATSEIDAHQIMADAHEAGLNFFDTSNTYGRPRAEGVTEQIVGNWFAAGSGRRDRTVLATKVYGGKGEWPNDRYLSAVHIRKACEDSLRRLRTDRIDLYQMHHVDRATPWEEIWSALDVLHTQGKIIYAGSSNFAGWHIAQAQEAAQRRHSFGLVSEQSLYNLAERTVELEVLPACQGYGLGVLPWSPLHGGLLGGILDKQASSHSPQSRPTVFDSPQSRPTVFDSPQSRPTATGRRAEGRAAETLTRFRPQVEAYEAFCAELGEPPAAVALAWLLHQPAVTAPIIGPRTRDQLTAPLRAAELALGAKELSRLDEIFPGPGPAPESYAW